MKKLTITKRCAKCGKISRVSRGVRTCYQAGTNAWNGRVYCWGTLTAVDKPKRAEKTRPQDVAGKLLAKAQQAIDEHLDRIKRSSAAIGRWQKKASYYAKRAAMSDEQLQAEREARELLAQQRKQGQKTRAIALEG